MNRKVTDSKSTVSMMQDLSLEEKLSKFENLKILQTIGTKVEIKFNFLQELEHLGEFIWLLIQKRENFML